jgi:putative ABC transport system permease protein
MLLKVEERRTDVAALRLIGISRRTIVVSLVIEATGLALVGSVLGGLLAVLASAVVNAVYRRVFATGLLFSELDLGTVSLALALSVVLGVLAGLAAATRLSRTSPMRLWGRRS